MKIILSSFNGMMKSSPMEIPEESSYEWHMVLTQPVTIITKKLDTEVPMHTVCKFRWNGKMDSGCRVYDLVDIFKR